MVEQTYGSSSARIIKKLLNSSNPRAIFGVKDTKKTFHQMCLAIHPDKCGHPQATEAFQKLQKLYQLSRDSNKNYDLKQKNKRFSRDYPLPQNKTTIKENIICKLFDENALFVEETCFGKLFMRFFIPDSAKSQDLVLKIQENGGEVSQYFDNFVYQIAKNQRQSLKCFYESSIYSEDWILQSIKNKKILNKNDFYVCQGYIPLNRFIKSSEFTAIDYLYLKRGFKLKIDRKNKILVKDLNNFQKQKPTDIIADVLQRKKKFSQDCFIPFNSFISKIAQELNASLLQIETEQHPII